MSYALCSTCGTHLRNHDSPCPSCTRNASRSRSKVLATALGVTLAAGVASCDRIPNPVAPQSLYGAPPMVEEADTGDQPEGSGEGPESQPTEGSGAATALPEELPPAMAIYGAPPDMEPEGSGDKPATDELAEPPKG